LKKGEPFKNVRGHLSGVNIDQCIFCGICARKCPSDALVVNKAEKSWEVDQFKCVVCGLCQDVCPKKCINMDDNHKTAAYKKEKSKFVQA